MLSFSEFRSTRELCELALSHNLDLKYLNEAILSTGPRLTEDDVLNEFLRQAWNALKSGLGAGTSAAKEGYKLTPQQAYDDVMKDATKLQASLKTFGLNDAQIDSMVKQITNFVTKQHNARSKGTP